MDRPDTTLEIRTFGRFSISVDGKPVATEWPDEAVKTLFCSLLSPLDLFFTWDRISRALLGVPATRIIRRQLEKSVIRTLGGFLIKECGFNPVVSGPEGIRIDHTRVNVDALEYFTSVLEGLRLLSLADYSEAHEKFSRADALYAGSYLPGMPGKIIESTRNELETLYRTAVMDGIGHVRTAQHFQAPARRVA